MFTLLECGGMVIPDQIISIIGTVINLIKIAVPLLLIIFGMLDLGKAVMAQKEDEIKRGQQMFVKRLIAAAIVFFVVVIVQFVVQLVDASDPNGTDTWTCVSKILGN